MDAGLYELLFTQKRTSFSQFSSQGSSVTLYVPFGGTVSYVPLATKLAIGFVRFESLRSGFVDSRFESIGMD